MGGHKIFSSLQNHGVKLAKFKQGVLFKELLQEGGISQEQEGILAHGACAALCCMWLYISLYEKGSLDRSADRAVDATTNLPFARIGVGLQHEFMKNFDPNEWSKLTTEMYDYFDLRLEIDGVLHKGFKKLLGEGASLLKWRPGVLLSLDLSNGSGHAIAMCRLNGSTYFFDPNAGVYEITSTNLINFLTEYAKVAPVALGYKVTGGHRVGVSKK